MLHERIWTVLGIEGHPLQSKSYDEASAGDLAEAAMLLIQAAERIVHGEEQFAILNSEAKKLGLTLFKTSPERNIFRYILARDGYVLLDKVTLGEIRAELDRLSGQAA